ncbi:hypothetical protein ACHAXS_001209, partial [Conticribra weissflogii]
LPTKNHHVSKSQYANDDKNSDLHTALATYQSYSSYGSTSMKTPRFQCKQPGGRERKKFPDVLYEILSDPRNYHIIYWMPHGRSWRVHDREKLAKVLCPRYFNHCKFESFTRSATGWGFKVTRYRKHV